MKGNKIFAGLIAGAALGTVAGLLIAPKQGRESRQIVTTRAGELRHKAGDYMDVMRSWKKSNLSWLRTAMRMAPSKDPFQPAEQKVGNLAIH